MIWSVRPQHGHRVPQKKKTSLHQWIIIIMTKSASSRHDEGIWAWNLKSENVKHHDLKHCCAIAIRVRVRELRR